MIKTKRKAIWLAFVCILAYLVVYIGLSAGIPYALSGDPKVFINPDPRFGELGVLLGLGLIAIMVVAAVPILGLGLYEYFDESHFGSGASARWALAGAVFAALQYGMDQLFRRDGNPWMAGINFLAEVAMLPIAYWVVFRWIKRR